MPDLDSLTLRAGDLRTLVTIQALGGADAMGQPNTWTTVRTCYAKVSTLSSKEVYLTQQFTSEVSTVVSVRWTPDTIQAGMQLTYGSRTLNISGVENVQERNIRLNIMCTELNGKV